MPYVIKYKIHNRELTLLTLNINAPSTLHEIKAVIRGDNEVLLNYRKIKVENLTFDKDIIKVKTKEASYIFDEYIYLDQIKEFSNIRNELLSRRRHSKGYNYFLEGILIPLFKILASAVLLIEEVSSFKWFERRNLERFSKVIECLRQKYEIKGKYVTLERLKFCIRESLNMHDEYYVNNFLETLYRLGFIRPKAKPLTSWSEIKEVEIVKD